MGQNIISVLLKIILRCASKWLLC